MVAAGERESQPSGEIDVPEHAAFTYVHAARSSPDYSSGLASMAQTLDRP